MIPIEELEVSMTKNFYFWFDNGNIFTFKGQSGFKLWYKNRKLHREDGPAVEFANGKKFWWLNGKFLYSKV